MHVIIKNFINLQDCDSRIKEVRRKREECPARIKALENDLKLVETQANEELSKIDVCKRKRRQIEQDIEDIESRILKSKGKLANVKSNKEYAAALKEIDDLERQKSLSEDRVLELMEEIDVLERRCTEIELKRKASRKKLEKNQKAVQEELKDFERDLEKNEKKRKRIREQIDDELLKQYDYVIQHRGGIAVSPVVKGVCQTCHMGIPPQKFNELMKGKELMNCPNCMRIIYWGEDERFKDAI